MNAKKWLTEMLGGISFDKKPEAWRWLNALIMAVNDHAEVNEQQENLLNTVCGEASCGWRKSGEGKIPDDVFTIAAWINSCQVR